MLSNGSTSSTGSQGGVSPVSPSTAENANNNSVIKAVFQAVVEEKENDDSDYDTVAESLIEEVAKESFFHGSITNEDAKEILLNQGDFLVRTPEKAHAQASVAIRVGREVKDFPMLFLKHGKTLKERLVTINGNYVKNSITQLIKDHMSLKIPIHMNSKLTLGNPVARGKWELPKNLLTRGVVIGEGAFGSVWSGKLRPEKGDGPPCPVAIKVTKLSKENKANVEEMLTEAKLMRQFQDTNVVAFYGIILDAGQVMIVMELVEGGGLDKYLKKNKVATTMKYSYCFDVASGLGYLHSKRFIHRDVASRNCLIDPAKNIVKISDFGMSKQGDQYKIQATDRTPIRWQAPEVLKTAVYTKECDVYSFAMVMYEIFNDGKQPFDGIDNKTIRTKIHDPTFRPPVPNNIANDVKAVMVMSWAAHPKQRITMRFAAFTLSKYCKHNPQLAKLGANAPVPVIINPKVLKQPVSGEVDKVLKDRISKDPKSKIAPVSCEDAKGPKGPKKTKVMEPSKSTIKSTSNTQQVSQVSPQIKSLPTKNMTKPPKK